MKGVVNRFDEPDQTVVVVVEDDCVALLVFLITRAKVPWEPDAVVLMGEDGAERLADAVANAAMKVREAHLNGLATTGGN